MRAGVNGRKGSQCTQNVGCGVVFCAVSIFESSSITNALEAALHLDHDDDCDYRMHDLDRVLFWWVRHAHKSQSTMPDSVNGSRHEIELKFGDLV